MWAESRVYSTKSNSLIGILLYRKLFIYMKICLSKDCKYADTIQPFENFQKRSTTKDKHSLYCRSCLSLRRKKYFKENRGRTLESNKKSYRKNIQKEKLRKKKYREMHQKETSQKGKIYYEKNKEKILLRQKARRKEINKTQQERRKNDPNFRIRVYLRSRIRSSVKDKCKSGSAILDMGCSMDTLIQRFESMFPLNPAHLILGPMSWENQGRKNGVRGWDIDHIIPLAAFDLTDREQFLKAVHYTNLRPMWAEQNNREKDRGMRLKKVK